MSLRRPFTAALAAGAMIVAPLASAIPALAADSPTVSVSPDSDLDPENANTLEVVGADFSTEGSGVYVAVAPAGVTDIDGWHLNAALFTGAEWVGSIDDDGSFSQELTLDSPVIDSDGNEVDCTASECGVYTWAAHGSSDRSQDTYTPISFAEVGDSPGDGEDEGEEPGDGEDEGDEPGDGEDEGEEPGDGEDEGEEPGDGEDDGEEPGDGEDEGDDGDDGSENDDGQEDDDDAAVWEPQLALLDADGNELGNDDVVAGDTITVQGTDFDPEANVGGRGVPIPNHLPQGYYVVFGKFSPDWKPSEGAASSAREVGDQGWVLHEDVLDEVPDMFQGAIRDQWVPLTDTGEFEATLEAEDLEDGPADGVYGVYIYPAGGVDNADFELAQPVNYTPESQSEDPPGDEDDDPAPEPEDKCLAVTDGDFTWGIHDGFVDYITGNIANGSISTSGVRETSSGYAFKYGSGNFDSDDDTGVVKFTGSVRFKGHGGQLDVKLGNPEFHINKKQATILLDVTTNGKLDKKVPFAIVDLKNAKTTATSFAVNKASAVLTDQGSDAMQGFYEPGEEVAPVTATLTLGGAGDCGDDVVSGQKPKGNGGTGGGQPSKGSTPNVNLVGKNRQTQTEDVAMCRSIQGASLSWGVKKSFTDYVTGPIANGSIERANGVSGSFNWPGRTANFDPDAGTGELSFGGTVTFSGHDGALNMRISNPRVVIDNDSQARLYADVRSTNPAGKVTVDAGGVHLANLNVSGKKSVSGDTITFNSVPATLTSAGVPAFAEFYEAGSALDALSLTVTLGPEVPCDSLDSGTDSLPRTGGDLELAAAGAAFLLLGVAALGVRRKARATK